MKSRKKNAERKAEEMGKGSRMRAVLTVEEPDSTVPNKEVPSRGLPFCSKNANLFGAFVFFVKRNFLFSSRPFFEIALLDRA